MAEQHRLTIDHLVVTRGPRSGKVKVKRVIELQISGDTAEVLKWLRNSVLVFEERLRKEQAEGVS